MSRRVGFARWRSDVPSGGNRYDEQLTTGLRALGVDLREYAVAGPWPTPGRDDLRRFEELLTHEQHWLVGNIVGSAAPETIGAAVEAGRRVTMLVHYFPADDPNLDPVDRRRLATAEADAVAVASDVVATSAWAAAEIARRYGRGDAVVAVPGVDPAPLSDGSVRSGGPAQLLWLGRGSRGKDPLTVIDALSQVRDHVWTARLVGPDDVDEGLSSQVRDRIVSLGLAGRVDVPGPMQGRDLEAVWSPTDLLVHSSRSEVYGMVVSEALAHGIPSLVAEGTGAVEAQQGVGATFPPGDADALAAALGEWLTDRALRDRWRDAAARQRAQVPTWAQTASAVFQVLER
ncbi:glycosyltransferase family 4 protein [Blastococcus sp. Marseille-P5729]|uniref:glycosyltransferase family 4 protein n=1 Tax=Blastococcus sp. Marseille-P5729 TaxID=2086582 RepID=UPI000D104AE6|nr:glycosyltransferase family 4 protein [Blastococcus sp. Marseille-P5729]